MREALNGRWTEEGGEGRQAAFLWPQLPELQSLKCSAVSTPTTSGRVTKEIKQHDVSVFSIKGGTGNQRATVYMSTVLLAPTIFPPLAD